jgi:Flp pilus assembly protein TadG
MKSWLEWLFPKHRRVATRHMRPDLVAYYWDGGEPKSHDLLDISSTGLYLSTDDSWYPGTQVMVTLQRVGAAETDPERSITVNAKVVRMGKNGVGLQLVLLEEKVRKGVHSVSLNGADRKTFYRFLQRLTGNQGQALVEYVLVLPFLLLLMVNVVNLGGFFAAWIAVANAARAGAQYAILSGASAGSLSPATAAQVNSLIVQDISSLPNHASLSVNICQNNSGTVVALAGTCTSVATDPEPASYVLLSVDVTYTYLPFIGGFTFPNLNIYATIPPTSIHRRTVMRVIQ